MPLRFVDESGGGGSSATEPSYVRCYKATTQAVGAATWSLLKAWTEDSARGTWNVPDATREYWIPPADGLYQVNVAVTRSVATNTFIIALALGPIMATTTPLYGYTSTSGTSQLSTSATIPITTTDKLYLHVYSTDACNMPAGTNIQDRATIQITYLGDFV